MIFVLEDDENILSLVLYALDSAKLESRGFNNAKDFFNALESAKNLPSCLVLDVMLGSDSGLSILSKLRANAKYKQMPIIMLSALGSEGDKIKGLDKGADDYLAKPFSALELIARIKALLRRSQGDIKDEINFKGIKWSKASHSVSIDSRQVSLTLKEFDLLGLFLAHKNRIFSREELLEIIWGYNIKDTRTVDIHINTLRKKLGAYASHIKTTRGVGYHFGED